MHYNKIFSERQLPNGTYILELGDSIHKSYTISRFKDKPDRNIFYDKLLTPRECGYQGKDDLPYLIAAAVSNKYDPEYDEVYCDGYSICTLNAFNGEQNFDLGIFTPIQYDDFDWYSCFRTPEFSEHDKWFYKNSCLLLNAKDKVGEFSVNKNGKLEYHFEYGLGVRPYGFETHDMQKTATFAFDNFCNLILKVNGFYELGDVNYDIIVAKDIKTGKYGYINKQGHVLIPFRYDKAYDFKPQWSTTRVEVNGQIYAIYRNGTISESETEELRRIEEDREW